MRKRRNEEPEKQSFRQKVAESFDASKEIILDVLKVELLGSSEAVVENYKGIVEYTPKRIVLEANPRQFRICGNNLEIKCVTREMLFVSGVIDTIGFLKEGAEGL